MKQSEFKANQDAGVESAIRRLGGAHLLLVGDNEINLKLAYELLNSQGIIVVSASNSLEALYLIEAQDFDGVLMDCQMQVMDGYETSRYIRDRLGMKNLPIIALTANAVADDMQKVLDSGINDYIVKPIRSAEMFNTLAKWIKSPDCSEEMLDIEFLEANRMELQLKPLLINQLIDEINEHVFLRMKHKNLSWEFYIDDRTPDCLLGDYDKIKQVLLSLLDNAIKFTEAGGRIEFFVRPCNESVVDSRRTELLFLVKDSGIGLTPDQQKALFQPFSQVFGSLSRKLVGIDQGLATSKCLVDMMQGKLWVESVYGVGSSFCLSLPLKNTSGRIVSKI